MKRPGASNDEQVPELVGGANKVETTGQPPLRDSAGVEDDAEGVKDVPKEDSAKHVLNHEGIEAKCNPSVKAHHERAQRRRTMRPYSKDSEAISMEKRDKRYDHSCE